jgi:lysophospholipase L1-like esterase
MTRRLLALSLALAACSGNPGPARTPTARPESLQTYPGSDPRILPMGRYVLAGDTVAFGASGVAFYLKFRGQELDAHIADEFRWGANYNWFTVAVDGREPTRFRTEPGKTWYPLARNLAPGVHTVALSKATEGQNGTNQLIEVRTRQLLQADRLPARRIEVIGNSISAGYGADARLIPCGKANWFDQTSAWLAYGPLLARRLHAQWMLSAISGIGVTRNWNSPGPTMPVVYTSVFMHYDDTASGWDFRRYQPDLLMVALGTNDFSDGGGPTPRAALNGDLFVNEYTAFLARLRGYYPHARFLLLNSPTLAAERKQLLAAYLQRVIDKRKAAGDMAITRFDFPGHWASGCSGHPDLQQQALMANALEPVVKRLMHW